MRDVGGAEGTRQDINSKDAPGNSVPTARGTTAKLMNKQMKGSRDGSEAKNASLANTRLRV